MRAWKAQASGPSPFWEGINAPDVPVASALLEERQESLDAQVCASEDGPERASIQGVMERYGDRCATYAPKTHVASALAGYLVAEFSEGLDAILPGQRR